jgi:hypothetical protein
MIASIRSRLLHLAELTNEEIFAGLDSPVASKLIREMGTGCIDVCVRESTHAARDPLVTLERRKELFQIGSRAKRRQIAIVFAREAFARVSVAEPCGYDHRRRGRGSWHFSGDPGGTRIVAQGHCLTSRNSWLPLLGTDEPL